MEYNKILYLTTVPWGWIKQRPHFLAECLSTDNIVDVYCKIPNAIKKKDLLTRVDLSYKNLSVSSFRLLPFHAVPIIRDLPLGWINKLLMSIELPDFRNYDIIWVTSPPLYNYVKAHIRPTQKLIYDCMDDLLEFPSVKKNNSMRLKYLQYENRLIQDATHVLCSAEYLKNKVCERTSADANKIFVVNNAIEIPQKIYDSTDIPNEVYNIVKFLDNNKSLLYIGTIDEWFDFKSVIATLNKETDLHLVLIGPVRGSLPEHERIHHMGTIQHDYIFNIMPHAFSLVMPFQLNELIRSVNPVKLYEYIYAGVPVIATKYSETMKFKDFVYLYGDKDDFYSIVKSIKEGCYELNIERNYKYVRENTWIERYKSIKSILDDKK